MSDLKRYEEELAKRLKELSSPNKDLVWQKIESLLDKDEDRGGAIFWDRTKLFLGILLLFISISILCFIFLQRPANSAATGNNEFASKNITPKKGIIGIEKNDSTSTGINNKMNDSIQLQNEKEVTGISSSKNGKIITFESRTENNLYKARKKKIISRSHLKITTQHRAVFNTEDPNVGDDEPAELINPEKRTGDSSKNVFSKTETITPTADTGKVKDNKVISVNKDAPKDTVKTKNKKISYWAAGLAVQQSANLDCHCLYTNSTYTANPKVLDYLPSAYIRFYHGQKWFLQAEFKYAAPQYINAFTYKITVQNDPFSRIVTAYTLKKVYSSQAEASYHYFILPNLSFGTGIIYNLFSGADIQKDVYRKQFESANDALLGSVNINNTSDSGFNSRMRNDFQWLLESQYKWNHLSIGLNYSIGLAAYAKYIDPYSGLPIQRNKNTLNIFVRYELWRSGK